MKGIAGRHGRRSSIARRKPHAIPRQWSRDFLREDFARASRALKVDWDAGIIYGVKVCGYQSINGRKYTPDCLEDACPLYEGAMVNIDHPKTDPDETRSAYDRFGKLLGLYMEDDGPHANLHFLKTHPMAKRVCEDAERNLGVYGLSHNAKGKGQTDDNGVETVQEITRVRHVDLVADPATVTNLFESRRPRMAARKQAKGKGRTKPLTEDGTGRPGDDERQSQAVVNPDLVKDQIEDDEEPVPGEDDEPDVHEHAAGMFAALLDDLKSGELDYDGFKAKVGKLLGFFDDNGGEDEEDDEDMGDDEEECDKHEGIDLKTLKALAGSKDPNVRKLVESVDRLVAVNRVNAARIQAQRLCSKLKLPKKAITPVFLESLQAAGSPKRMKQMIRDRRALVESRRPVSIGQGGNGLRGDLDVKGVSRLLKR